MKTEEAIKKAGSRAALARILGIRPQATYVWKGALPEGRVWQLRSIRPEWFSDNPELAEPANARRSLAGKVSQLACLVREVQQDIEQIETGALAGTSGGGHE